MARIIPNNALDAEDPAYYDPTSDDPLLLPFGTEDLQTDPTWTGGESSGISSTCNFNAQRHGGPCRGNDSNGAGTGKRTREDFETACEEEKDFDPEDLNSLLGLHC